MATSAVSLKILTKLEEVRKLEKELIRLITYIPIRYSAIFLTVGEEKISKINGSIIKIHYLKTRLYFFQCATE